MDCMSDVLSVFWIVAAFLVPLILIALWLKGIIKQQRNTDKFVNMTPKGEPVYSESMVPPLFLSPYYSNKSISQDGD